MTTARMYQCESLEPMKSMLCKEFGFKEHKTVLHLKSGGIHLILTKHKNSVVSVLAHRDVQCSRNLLKPHETRKCDITEILKKLDDTFKNFRVTKEFYDGKGGN